MDIFDTAQICLNGHVINFRAKKYPHYNKNFCEKCGAKTITQCPNCSHSIRGVLVDDYYLGEFPVPNFCLNCGAPYPWTVTAIEAAKELAYELDLLDEQEQAALADTIDDLVKENPKTQVAAVRFKRLVLKAGERVGAMFMDILKDVLSETIKKTIFSG